MQKAERRTGDLRVLVFCVKGGRPLAVANGLQDLQNARHTRDDRPLQPGCPCVACRRHSRGYLRHLFMAGETLGQMLVSAHNLTYYQTLMRDAREAIEQGRFAEFKREKQAGWGGS